MHPSVYSSVPLEHYSLIINEGLSIVLYIPITELLEDDTIVPGYSMPLWTYPAMKSTQRIHSECGSLLSGHEIVSSYNP